MKEEKICKVIQDLLPNYIEKLTNMETNEFIEKHLKECPDCMQIYNNMQKKLDINDNQKIVNQEVKYFKKYNNRLKLLRNILILIILIIGIIVGRKTIILTNISNKVKEVEDINNYYIKTESYLDGEMIIAETKHKDNKILITRTIYSKDDKIIKNIIYTDEEEKFILTDDGINKTLINLSEVLIDTPSYHSKNFLENMRIAITTSIGKINIKGKECYILKEGDTEKFIDSQSGLTVKMIHNDANSTINYQYEYGIVTDSDVIRPNTDGFTVTKY